MEVGDNSLILERKAMKLWPAMALLLLMWTGLLHAAGPTEESGVISENTTWKLNNSPYIIKGSVNVSSGATLTIEAGVTVKFDGDYNLVIDGTLVAQGTADKLITFTSNQTIKSAGNWGQIQFRDTSVDNNCLIQHAVIKYGTTGVNCSKASPTIANSTIRHHKYSGIQASGENQSNGPSGCVVANA